MTQSHPPTLLTLATRTIREAALFARGDRVLVALSGGPDSMALLHVLAHLRRTIGHDVVAHGVDHGLREGAAGELDQAEAFAARLEVRFDRTHVEVARGGNLQARARAARYDALRAAAAREGAKVIATGHQRDDRAETVLLRLLRGAGPRGLGVLAPRADDLVRPLVRAARAAVEAHLARHAIPFARDPSNNDPRFLRARVRHELLPLLRALSPGIDEHLCALADQLAEAESDPLTLPRATRKALAELLARPFTHTRVALPGGLAVTWDTRDSRGRDRPKDRQGTRK